MTDILVYTEEQDNVIAGSVEPREIVVAVVGEVGGGGGGGGAGGAVDSVNGQTGVVVLDTDDISEGAANLYFTTGRAAAAAPVQSVDGQTGAVSLSGSYAPLSHVGSGGTAHSAATTSVAGFMSATDKTKLDGIAAGAQVNVPTDLSLGTITTTSIPLNSSTGADVTLPSATTSLAGLQSAADKTKLDGVAAGATANANTDTLAEGATNKYFTEGRVRGTVLTGLSLLTGGVISAADSVLSSLGKLQKQISDAVTAIGGKQDTLVSGTNLKTVNGVSLLGSGDLAVLGDVGGAAPSPVVLENLGAAVPVPAAVSQLMTCYTSAWIAINTDSAWGWKRIGKPAVAYGLSAAATPYSPGSANTSVAGLYAEIYVGPVAAGATVHNSIRLPLLPQGMALLDPMLIGVVDLSGKSASHALRLYDDEYTATDIWLNCHDGIDVQAVRQTGYVELTATENVLYEISLSHYDDGTLAEIGIDAVRSPVRVPTSGLGSMA